MVGAYVGCVCRCDGWYVCRYDEEIDKRILDNLALLRCMMIFTCVGDIWRYDGWYVCCSVDLFAVRLKYTIMYTYFHVSLKLQLKHQAVWALLPSHHLYRIELNGYIHPRAISLSHLRL